MTLDLIPFIFLFSSYSSLSPTIRIHFPKHTITCAPVHIILRFWPVCHQFYYWTFTHGWLCALCVHFVILEVVILCVCMRTWLNLCKMLPFLCRVLQKTLSKLERVWKQVKCVKSFKKRVFVSRTIWMVWKIVIWISYSVLAIEKNCKWRTASTLSMYFT